MYTIMVNIKKMKKLTWFVIGLIILIVVISFAGKDIFSSKTEKNPNTNNTSSSVEVSNNVDHVNYYGKWQVYKNYTPPMVVSSADEGLSQSEINNYSKATITLGKTDLSLFKGKCSDYKYGNQYVGTIEWLYDNYRVLADVNKTTTTTINPKDLDISADQINISEITCDNDYYNLIVKDDNNIIIENNNVFFFLKRSN